MGGMIFVFTDSAQTLNNSLWETGWTVRFCIWASDTSRLPRDCSGRFVLQDPEILLTYITGQTVNTDL